MKRSKINAIIREAASAFERHGWVLPPKPRWDVTDFGLGDFERIGLTLVNLAEQPEYCEKIMYVKNKQVTPTHYHALKKEDIICRWGKLAVQLSGDSDTIRLQVNGEETDIPIGKPLILSSGERITMNPGVRHSFWAESEYAIVGEVSTANDDLHDNFFDNPDIGRFSKIEEDEPAIVKLVSD
ncbi:MAG: D-lyxose/D-mannose family sugar isomerase [Clostridiales bacterium]|jgi:D-lyxose ketol-isomerase|nr:D-lyxose/D-mannose family sugar isomerase [Clostridiales bacterium]